MGLATIDLHSLKVHRLVRDALSPPCVTKNGRARSWGREEGLLVVYKVQTKLYKIPKFGVNRPNSKQDTAI